MSSNKTPSPWQIKQRQEQLQAIANSFTEPDGVEYVVTLSIKESTPPNQLNFQFEDKCDCSTKNNY